MTWGKQVMPSSQAVMLPAEIARVDRATAEAFRGRHAWQSEPFTDQSQEVGSGRLLVIVVRMAHMDVYAAAAKQLKILYMVVSAVAVDVMHRLARIKRAAKILLHNPTMLQHGMIANAERHIARFVLTRRQSDTSSSPLAGIVHLAQAMPINRPVATFNATGFGSRVV
jgi:hypothetical protein